MYEVVAIGRYESPACNCKVWSEKMKHTLTDYLQYVF